MRRLRLALLRAVRPADIKEIVGMLIVKAKAGERWGSKSCWTGSSAARLRAPPIC